MVNVLWVTLATRPMGDCGGVRGYKLDYEGI
jgi:hypothetical protein